MSVQIGVNTLGNLPARLSLNYFIFDNGVPFVVPIVSTLVMLTSTINNAVFISNAQVTFLFLLIYCVGSLMLTMNQKAWCFRRTSFVFNDSRQFFEYIDCDTL